MQAPARVFVRERHERREIIIVPYNGPDRISAMTPAAKRAVFRFLTVREVGRVAAWSVGWSRGLRGLLRHDAQHWFQRFVPYLEGTYEIAPGMPMNITPEEALPMDLCLAVATPEVRRVNFVYPSIRWCPAVERALAPVLPALQAFVSPHNVGEPMMDLVIRNAPALQWLHVTSMQPDVEQPLRGFECPHLLGLYVGVTVRDRESRPDASPATLAVMRTAEEAIAIATDEMEVACHNLLSLGLFDYSDALPPAFFEKVGAACPRLRSLSLCGGYGLNPYEFSFESFAQLREFSISRTTATAFVAQLERHCPLLDDLAIDASLMTDNGVTILEPLMSLFRARPNMRRIFISYAPLLMAGAMLRTIAQSCPRLRVLYFYSSNDWPRNDVEGDDAIAVIRGCPELRTLHLPNVCVTGAVLRALITSLPHLRDFNRLDFSIGGGLSSDLGERLEYVTAKDVLFAVRPELAKRVPHRAECEVDQMRRRARVLIDPEFE